MSAYGLGVELSTSEVSWASATGITGLGPASSTPAVVVIIDGRLVAGAAAVAAAAASPANVVRDVVAEFEVDRLWLVGGQMVTPDDALRAILAGCIADAREALGSSPGAVTVSCPAGWGQATLQRVDSIATSLGFVLPKIGVSLGVAAAAIEASSRLPIQGSRGVAAGDLPPLPIAPILSSQSNSAVAPPPPAPIRPRHRRRFGWMVWVLVVLGIPAIVVVALRAAREPERTTTAPSDTTELAGPAVQDLATTTTAPSPVLTIGYLSTGDAATEELLRTKIDALSTVGASTSPRIFLVVQPPSSDLTGVITQLRGQGVTVLISDATGDQQDQVAQAARQAALPLCLTAPEITDSVRGPGIALGDLDRCPEFLALAALEANSVEPARIMSAMPALAPGDGISCTTYAQCAAFVSASQPVSFQPAGGPLRLAPDN